jgi:hypothetical protein
MADALNYTLRSPIGIAGLITPWNLPLYLLSWKVCVPRSVSLAPPPPASTLCPALPCPAHPL